MYPSLLTWPNRNRQTRSTAKSLRCHISVDGILDREGWGQFPLPFIDRSASAMVAKWDGGKVYICSQGQFNKLMSTREECAQGLPFRHVVFTDPSSGLWVIVLLAWTFSPILPKVSTTSSPLNSHVKPLRETRHLATFWFQNSSVRSL